MNNRNRQQRCHMPDISALLQKASDLGNALAEHPAVREYHAAQHAVRADADAQRILKEHEEQLNRIHQLETKNQPIEVADKQKLRETEAHIFSNEALKRFTRAQTEYVALMNQVNRTLEEPLAKLAPAEPPQ